MVPFAIEDARHGDGTSEFQISKFATNFLDLRLFVDYYSPRFRDFLYGRNISSVKRYKILREIFVFFIFFLSNLDLIVLGISENVRRL